MEFQQISSTQYFITNRNDDEFGHLIRDSSDKWVYFVSRPRIVFFENELQLIIDKLKELNSSPKE